MEFKYGWEKLHMAVHSLAGSASQPERLSNAVVFSLIHITPENDLPEEIRDEFKEFMSDITNVEAKADEGSVQATVNTLDELQISNHVDKIISFYDTVCRYMPR
ncbi:hypothetical protein ACFL2V_21750 [Pseudomonadota bacterium]